MNHEEKYGWVNFGVIRTPNQTLLKSTQITVPFFPTLIPGMIICPKDQKRILMPYLEHSVLKERDSRHRLVIYIYQSSASKPTIP